MVDAVCVMSGSMHERAWSVNSDRCARVGVGGAGAGDSLVVAGCWAAGGRRKKTHGPNGRVGWGWWWVGVRGEAARDPGGAHRQ